MKCTVLPADVADSLVFSLLGQFHIKGKKDWAPYEQAGFLYRRFTNHHVSSEILATELGLSTRMVNHLIHTYQFMIDNEETDINRWSHYDEYLKSNKIKRARQTYPEMDELIVECIKDGTIERAMDLRDQLPVVCESPVTLKKFISRKLSLEESFERAVDSGVDSTPYKKAAAFRRWITGEEVDHVISNSPKKACDKLMYELDKIYVRIAAIKKKHG